MVIFWDVGSIPTISTTPGPRRHVVEARVFTDVASLSDGGLRASGRLAPFFVNTGSVPASTAALAAIENR